MSIIEKAFDKLNAHLPVNNPATPPVADHMVHNESATQPQTGTLSSLLEINTAAVQLSALSPEQTVTAPLTEPNLEPAATLSSRSIRPRAPKATSRARRNEPTLAGTQTELHVNINLDRLRGLNIITPHGNHSTTADAFRMIKRPLLNKAFDQDVTHGNLIMITSSLPGEGKTFCSINLAMSISMEMDKTVLLVDADVAKPSLMKTIGLPDDKKGLLDLLQDSSLSVADVLMKTNIANLTILSAGQYVRHATELLASDAMVKLLEELAQRYPDRIILFDSPPLLVTTESSVLATHMGQIVVVVEAERTPQSALQNSLELIEFCNLTGIVLNKSQRMPILDYGYGYGYGQE